MLGRGGARRTRRWRCCPTRSPWCRARTSRHARQRRVHRPRCARARRRRSDGAELGATQPTTLTRPRGDGGRLLAAGNYAARWREVDRFRADRAGASRAPLRQGAHPLRLGRRGPRRGGARRRSTPWRREDFRPDARRHRRVVGDIAAAANVFAYQGDVGQRRQGASTWPTRCAGRSIPRPGSRRPRERDARHWRAGRALRRDRRARRLAAPGLAERRGGGPHGLGRAARSMLAHGGAAAAIGLFTGPAADSTR